MNPNIEPQSVCSPITSAAMFMVATLAPGSDAARPVREWCGDIAALTRSVGKRVPGGNLTCVCGFGSTAWDALFGSPRPASLHPFQAVGVAGRMAVATPGDVLLHIRAEPIGRTKLSDIELADEVKPSNSHSALTTITEDGEEVKILRDNMPFGRPGAGEFGTYFIGYARSPQPLERMLENMFVGLPAGNYDRLLDFSTAVTGGLFFVPSADLLEQLAEGQGRLCT